MKEKELEELQRNYYALSELNRVLQNKGLQPLNDVNMRSLSSLAQMQESGNVKELTEKQQELSQHLESVSNFFSKPGEKLLEDFDVADLNFFKRRLQLLDREPSLESGLENLEQIIESQKEVHGLAFEYQQVFSELQNQILQFRMQSEQHDMDDTQIEEFFAQLPSLYERLDKASYDLYTNGDSSLTEFGDRVQNLMTAYAHFGSDNHIWFEPKTGEGIDDIKHKREILNKLSANLNPVVNTAKLENGQLSLRMDCISDSQIMFDALKSQYSNINVTIENELGGARTITADLSNLTTEQQNMLTQNLLGTELKEGEVKTTVPIDLYDLRYMALAETSKELSSAVIESLNSSDEELNEKIHTLATAVIIDSQNGYPPLTSGERDTNMLINSMSEIMLQIGKEMKNQAGLDGIYSGLFSMTMNQVELNQRLKHINSSQPDNPVQATENDLKSYLAYKYWDSCADSSNIPLVKKLFTSWAQAAEQKINPETKKLITEYYAQRDQNAMVIDAIKQSKSIGKDLQEKLAARYSDKSTTTSTQQRDQQQRGGGNQFGR